MLQIVIIANLLCPAVALAEVVDFTKTVENNSMLVILLLGTGGSIAFGIVKHLYSKMDEKLKKASEESDRAELKLKETEFANLKFQHQLLQDKINSIESSQHICQRTLPSLYVTKPDFDKSVETHREDINNITSRIEGIIKDLKTEIRSDMEVQIERIIALLNNKFN